MNEQQKTEVEWYLKNGKNTDRIARDRDGFKFIIGDFSWNAKQRDNHPDKVEYIEGLMPILSIKRAVSNAELTGSAPLRSPSWTAGYAALSTEIICTKI